MKKNVFNFWQKQIFLLSPLCIGAALGFFLQGLRKHNTLPLLPFTAVFLLLEITL
jgi:hypothetical protein